MFQVLHERSLCEQMPAYKGKGWNRLLQSQAAWIKIYDLSGPARDLAHPDYLDQVFVDTD